MESFESWLDPDDNFDPENDPTPEREEADEATIAKLFGIGPRHVRRLTRAGVLQKLANGNFHRMDSIDAFIAHATKPPAQTAGMRDRQAELLQRRLDREAKELIGREELVHTLGVIADANLAAFDEAVNGAAEVVADPDRARLVGQQGRALMAERVAKAIRPFRGSTS